MFRLAVFSALFAFCLSAPVNENVEKKMFYNEHEVIPILTQQFNVEYDGRFTSGFESGDGIKVHAEGSPKQLDAEHTVEVVSGGYEYTAPDGMKVAVNYVADENGFQPQSDILPKAPETPAAIARAIQYNLEHPQENEDGMTHHMTTGVVGTPVFVRSEAAKSFGKGIPVVVAGTKTN